MSKLIIFAPLLFVAACATDPNPSVNANVDTPDELPSVTVGVNAALQTNFWYRPNECFDNSIAFYPVISYSDGASTANVVCQYQFPDGSIVDGCAPVHSIPNLGPVIMTARDTVTGATATYQDNVVGPEHFTATIAVSTAGDTLSWDAHTLYGMTQDTGGVQIVIDPAANVIVDDPSVLTQLAGTVHVTTDGVYSVTVNGYYNFADLATCDATATGSVTVDCNGSSGGTNENGAPST